MMLMMLISCGEYWLTLCVDRNPIRTRGNFFFVNMLL